MREKHKKRPLKVLPLIFRINFLVYYVYITQYTLESVHIMYTNATTYSSTNI